MTAILIPDPDQTEFDKVFKHVCTTTASLHLDGTLTLHHISLGRDAAGVEHTMCGLVVPRRAARCTGDRWCPDCKDPDE